MDLVSNLSGYPILPMKLQAPHAPQVRSQPRSRRDLFCSFTVLALQGFGGVLAVVQHELVEKKRWLTRQEFIEDWAVAQIMPGANVVNLAMMVGGRYFGLSGAFAALGGMLLAPLIVVLVLASLYAHFAHHLALTGALRGMGAIAAGLVLASGLRLSKALADHPMGTIACVTLGALAFIAVALLHWPLVYVLFGLGGVTCTATYFRLAP